MTTSFLITGSTGNVGEAVLKYLAVNDPHSIYRATHRQNSSDPQERWLDFTDSHSFAGALHQIDVVFLLRPPQLADVNTYFVPFIDACRTASVKQIVFLSVQGADQVSFIPHAKIEKLIQQSGLAYTFVRPSYFMQNLTTTLREDIVQRHRLFLPSGQAPFLWVDINDLGRAIASILTHWPEHQNRAYTITGKQLLTFGQVSTLLSHTLGYQVRFESPNLLRFFLTKRAEGLSTGFILVMILLHFLPRFQKAPQISNDVKQLTNREPTTLAEFIDQHKSEWL